MLTALTVLAPFAALGYLIWRDPIGLGEAHAAKIAQREDEG